MKKIFVMQKVGDKVEKFEKFVKNKPELIWLRKQRDSLIGGIDEEMKNLKSQLRKTKELIYLLAERIKELVELNDEIYEIEYDLEFESDSDHLISDCESDDQNSGNKNE